MEFPIGLLLTSGGIPFTGFTCQPTTIWLLSIPCMYNPRYQLELNNLYAYLLKLSEEECFELVEAFKMGMEDELESYQV
jgi:hypothetical protein